MPKNLQIGLHKSKRFFENKQSLQTKNIKRPQKFPTGIQKYFIKRTISIVSDLNCRGFILSVVFDPRLASKCYSEKWTFLGVP